MLGLFRIAADNKAVSLHKNILDMQVCTAYYKLASGLNRTLRKQIVPIACSHDVGIPKTGKHFAGFVSNHSTISGHDDVAYFESCSEVIQHFPIDLRIGFVAVKDAMTHGDSASRQ